MTSLLSSPWATCSHLNPLIRMWLLFIFDDHWGKGIMCLPMPILEHDSKDHFETLIRLIFVIPDKFSTTWKTWMTFIPIKASVFSSQQVLTFLWGDLAIGELLEAQNGNIWAIWKITRKLRHSLSGALIPKFHFCSMGSQHFFLTLAPLLTQSQTWVTKTFLEVSSRIQTRWDCWMRGSISDEILMSSRCTVVYQTF